MAEKTGIAIKMQGILKTRLMMNTNTIEECLREEAEFWDECRKEAESIVPNKSGPGGCKQAEFECGW